MYMSKKKFNPIRPMLIVWATVFLIAVVVFIVSQLAGGESGKIIEAPTFQILSVILSFATFVMTTFFSFLILGHNKEVREMNITNKKENDDANARAEQFRELSYASTNYSVVEFVDHMAMYEEYKRYKDRLISTRDFAFYLREESINHNDILENFEKYDFLTIKIPFRIMEGKRVTTVRIERFLFTKNEKDYNFVPCSEDNRAMMLQDEANNRSAISVNLIIEKESEFYVPGKVSEFSKMRINLSMFSLLGVVVSGWMELYFTNPQKREKDGASIYMINSSRFRIAGLPGVINSPAITTATENKFGNKQ